MTGLNTQFLARDIIPLALWEEGVRRTGEGLVGCRSNVPHDIDCHPELVSGSHQMQQHTGQSNIQKMLKQVQHDINLLKRTYSPINLFTYSLHQKTAFTLAEVLITLGIIGVVAAMTMPSLIQNYQKKRTVTQLKATYSILAQAFEHAKADYGDMEYWGLDSIHGQTSGKQDIVKNVVETYFLPYIKPLKNYGMINFRNLGYDAIYNLDKSKADNSTLGGTRYIITLPNGTITAFSLDGHCDEEGTDENGNWVCNSQWYYTIVYIIVDINGKQNPNTFGKDIFVMKISNNKFAFYSYSNSENDRNTLLKYCSKGSNENRMCGRLIQLDGWEIKYDW